MIFDSHFHIIDRRFELVKNNGYIPSEFRSLDYCKIVKPLNVVGGAIVSGSFQQFDQSYLINALKELGNTFVGVTQIDTSITDAEIIRLNNCGVRAVRFNLRQGGSATLKDLEKLAFRVHELVSWHVELYVDSNLLNDLHDRLVKLPNFVIDHLGLSRKGLPKLLALVEKGAYVKATGFGRLDFDPQDAITAIINLNEDALIFGTDLPSTRAPRAFQPSDIDILLSSLTTEQLKKVLYTNAISLYRPDAHF